MSPIETLDPPKIELPPEIEARLELLRKIREDISHKSPNPKTGMGMKEMMAFEDEGLPEFVEFVEAIAVDEEDKPLPEEELFNHNLHVFVVDPKCSTEVVEEVEQRFIQFLQERNAREEEK